jgi:hypothetical protein
MAQVAAQIRLEQEKNGDMGKEQATQRASRLIFRPQADKEEKSACEIENDQDELLRRAIHYQEKCTNQKSV